MVITASFRKILLFITLVSILTYIHSLFWVDDAFLGARQAQADSLHTQVLARPYAKKGAPLTKISINTATNAELTQLPRIGKKMAARIIKYREENPFKSLDELKNVRGIGEKTFTKLKDMITL